MIDGPRLEGIRQAACDGDWALTGGLYIELSLAARGSADRVRVEAIAPYIRLRDAEGIAAVVDEILRGEGGERLNGGAPTKIELPVCPSLTAAAWRLRKRLNSRPFRSVIAWQMIYSAKTRRVP